jgi:hypothetical protein
MLVDGPAVRRRQVGPVEPALAMNVGGDPALADERPVGTGRDRQVAAADVLEDAKCVCRRLLERLVAGDRRDAEELDLRARQGEQERDRVVVTGVAVEEDRRRTQCRARSRSSYFLTLPVEVFGSSPNSIALGALKPGSDWRLNAISSSALSVAPGRRVT